jgi:hypothetical protein
MEPEKLLIVFENRKLPEEHVRCLSENYKLLRVSYSSEQLSNVSILSKSDLNHQSQTNISGPIAAPRFLFEFRDFYIIPLLLKYNISVLIYGGESTWMMPQYYIFKKILQSDGDLFIFLDHKLIVGPNFMDTILDEEFDGIRHVFNKVNQLGFQVYKESNISHD